MISQFCILTVFKKVETWMATNEIVFCILTAAEKIILPSTWSRAEWNTGFDRDPRTSGSSPCPWCDTWSNPVEEEENWKNGKMKFGRRRVTKTRGCKCLIYTSDFSTRFCHFCTRFCDFSPRFCYFSTRFCDFSYLVY